MNRLSALWVLFGKPLVKPFLYGLWFAANFTVVFVIKSWLFPLSSSLLGEIVFVGMLAFFLVIVELQVYESTPTVIVKTKLWVDDKKQRYRELRSA